MTRFVILGCVALVVGSGCGSDADEAAPSSSAQTADLPQEFLDSCGRMCTATAAAVAMDPCVNGTVLRRGVEVGEGRDLPERAAISDDEACVTFCSDFRENGGYDCWQQAAEWNECVADGPWVCDAETWLVPNCELPRDPALCSN